MNFTFEPMTLNSISKSPINTQNILIYMPITKKKNSFPNNSQFQSSYTAITLNFLPMILNYISK